MAKTSQQILAEHAASTLPDSIAQRRIVLKAILVNLKKGHPAYENVAEQLASLDRAEKLQAELPFHLEKGAI